MKPTSVFLDKKFTPMFFTQFLGAFNDNVFKQAFLLVLAYGGAAQMGLATSLATNLAALCFILPFFLFSALAGQIADNYAKSTLTQLIKLLEIVIMAIASVGFVMHWYGLLYVALFLMGTHSAFFGPIKYAYLPENLPKDKLIAANGLFQMGTSLAILTGMISAGILASLSNPNLWVSMATLLFAVMGYLAARAIPNTPVYDPKPIDKNILRTSIATIGYVHRLPLLFFVILGNSWFWFYGATFLTQTAEFGKTILHGNQTVGTFLLVLFSVGTASGSVLCKKLTNNQISLKLLPVGILGLTIFAVDLYFAAQSYHTFFINFSQTSLDQAHLSIAQILHPKGIRIFVDLFLLGGFGGLYIVPLYSMMQAFAPKEKRAQVVGANNIFNAFFMVMSAIFSVAVLSCFSLPMLFLITAFVNLAFGAFVYHNLKKHQHSMPLQTQ